MARVVLTYAPHGVLDRRATETFRTELRDAIDASDCVVVVDFAAVTFISSGAFSALVDCGHYATDHDMNVHQLACKWLLQQPALTSITGTFLNEKEIAEACESVDKPNLSREELSQIADDYNRDWNLGPDAHPCDLKSSTNPEGKVRSTYVPSPLLIA